MGIIFPYIFSTFLIYLDLGSIRFSIATSFLFLSTIYLLERKYKSFYILIILGIIFHKSLMLALILPILTQKKYLRIFFHCQYYIRVIIDFIL
ncbi:EpsG family protein [Photorhabdus temperata]|uniref:EpsG family protein n=1 Tax=Photorhabdus temperata TaxID=574560 RepID=UPI0013E3ACAB